MIRISMALSSGTRLGPYEIAEIIGKGGMGEVYRAHDPRLGRDVAIKVLPATLAEDPLYRERMEWEARAIARLQHPHVCALYDVGSEGQTRYLVMELLSGATLEERLSDGALELTESLDIAKAIAEALAAAHSQGLVHRDIKPSNVMLTPNGVKVLDFGLARRQEELVPEMGTQLATATSPLTEEGSLVGTLHYMSPEQIEGRGADARSDLWALGCVIYEMVAGRRAFDAPSKARLITTILTEEPDPVSSLTQVPPGLDIALAKALTKESSQRVASASALLDLLGSIEEKPRNAIPLAAEGSSVAVLPFRDLSPERNQEFLCDGLVEELIHALSGIDGLEVASRSGSYIALERGGDAQSAGRKLGVANALEGSVRRSGDRLRVTVQCVDTRSGLQLWSQRFDGLVDDIFEIQDQVAELAARKLRGTATPAPAREQRPFEAYEEYLKGRHQVRIASPESCRRAVAHYQRAVALDDTFAAAWAGWLEAVFILDEVGGEVPEVEIQEARAAGRRALELAPQLPEANFVNGRVAFCWDFDHAEGARVLEEVIRLDPEHSRAWGQLGFWHWLLTGDGEEGIRLIERAIQLDPWDPWPLMDIAWLHLGAGNYGEAVRTAQAARELEESPTSQIPQVFALELAGRAEEALLLARDLEARNDFPVAWMPLGWIAARNGGLDEVARIENRLESAQASGLRAAGDLAIVAAARGNREGFYRWMRELARTKLSVFCPVIANSAWLNPWLDEPEFRDLLREAGFVALADRPAKSG